MQRLQRTGRGRDKSKKIEGSSSESKKVDIARN